MPKIVNPEVINRVQEARLNGKSGKDSLLAGGLTMKTATHTVGNNKLLKLVDDKIEYELKASDLSADFIVNGLNDIRKLCLKGKKKDLSSAVRIFELYGKYLKLWSDSINNNVIIIDDKEKQSRLNRLKSMIESNKSNESNETKEVIDVEV